MSSRSAFLRAAVFAGWTLALAGCGSADYGEPVTAFAQATATAETALSELDRTVTSAYTTHLAERARTDFTVAVLANRDECELGSTRCRIVIANPSDRAKDEPYPPEPLLGNMVLLMGEVRTYAQNLAAVVADDSAAKAEAHVNAALGSIQELAGTVSSLDKQGTRPVPSFATPVGAAVNWIVGRYAETVKVAGLKRATREADPVIARAAALFTNAALFGSDLQREALTRRIQARIDAYQDDRASQANLDAAVDAARTYDTFLLSQPSRTFRGLAESHAALTKALNDPEPSWPQAIAKIQQFGAEARRLAKIAQDLAPLIEKK